jgi:hypothetical protein
MYERTVIDLIEGRSKTRKSVLVAEMAKEEKKLQKMRFHFL